MGGEPRRRGRPVALVIAATSLQPGTANVNDLSKQGDARVGLLALESSGIGPGALEPIEILAPAASAARVPAAVASVPGVHGVMAPANGQWRRDGTALVDAIPTADGSTPAGRDVIANVRAAAHGAAARRAGGRHRCRERGLRVGDLWQLPADDRADRRAHVPAAGARAFRLLVLPLKAVVLNIISVTAAWVVITLIWQEGHGSSLLYGIAATHSVTAWIPLMVFAFLFGLSMDYEVFILSRMREEYDRTGSTDEAVVTGISRTGRLVTSAALILFLAFVSMSSGPQTDAKVFATGLAAGILLDATIIRALLVPAIVSLFGRWNWWLPERPARWLRFEPSLPPRAASAEAS